MGPANPTANPTARRRSDGPSPAPGRPVLLIVDDDEAVRTSLKLIFEADFDLLLAPTGSHALEFMQNTPVDVVTLDLGLPDANGIDLLAKLKQIDPFAEAIVITGQGALDTAQQAITLRAFAYLTKPFDIHECRSAVGSALERRRRMLAWLAMEQQFQKQQIERQIERAQAEMSASVIHDLNTPLTTITGLLDLLLLDLELPSTTTTDTTGLARRLRDIAYQLTFCHAIIKRYLSLVRRTPAQPSTAALRELMLDLNSLLRAHPLARQRRLVIHHPEEEVHLRINAVDLLQLLINLTINALQASQATQQVEVYCRHWPEGVDASQRPAGSADVFEYADRLSANTPFVSITVQDEGAGIPADRLAGLFTDFGSSKPPGEGTGIGLMVAHRVVGQNGGALHVHTVPGEGTAFTVFLPVA